MFQLEEGVGSNVYPTGTCPERHGGVPNKEGMLKAVCGAWCDWGCNCPGQTVGQPPCEGGSKGQLSLADSEGLEGLSGFQRLGDTVDRLVCVIPIIVQIILVTFASTYFILF